ncbi:MAG: ATP synthase F1 subunit delta [Balneola sp.]|jgi:F-type H+-transporting ATPase subunit delta
MLVSKAARRYATALLESANEQGSIENTLKDIHFIKATIEASKELRAFLKSPVVKPADKQKALASIFDGKVSKEVSRFIVLLTSKGREDILDEVANAFIDVYNVHAGIITVEVKTAKALKEAQITELTKMLEKTTSKTVNLDLKEQVELRGGISVKIDDTVIDATIKHKLEQLETRFLESSME